MLVDAVHGDFCVTVGRFCSPWQHWKFIEQQVYGAPPFVIGLQKCHTKLCFGAGDGRDGELLLLEPCQHALLKRS